MYEFDVLLSVYSGEKPNQLDSCLESIFCQTLQPSNVVLVVDGLISSDLQAVINKYLNRESFKTVFKEPPNGLHHALNFGLLHCPSAFVLRMDTDDLVLAGRFEDQMTFFCQGFDIVGGQIIEFDERECERKTKILPLTSNRIYRYALFRNPFNHMTVGFKKDLVIEMGGYPDISFREDYALWDALICNGARTVNSSNVYCKVRAGKELVKRRLGLGHIIHEIKFFLFRAKRTNRNTLLLFSSLIIRAVLIGNIASLGLLFYLLR